MTLSKVVVQLTASSKVCAATGSVPIATSPSTVHHIIERDRLAVGQRDALPEYLGESVRDLQH